MAAPQDLASYIQGSFSDWLTTNKGLFCQGQYQDLQAKTQDFAGSLQDKSSFTGDELETLGDLFQ